MMPKGKTRAKRDLEAKIADLKGQLRIAEAQLLASRSDG